MWSTRGGGRRVIETTVYDDSHIYIYMMYTHNKRLLSCEKSIVPCTSSTHTTTNSVTSAYAHARKMRSACRTLWRPSEKKKKKITIITMIIKRSRTTTKKKMWKNFPLVHDVSSDVHKIVQYPSSSRYRVSHITHNTITRMTRHPDGIIYKYKTYVVYIYIS